MGFLMDGLDAEGYDRSYSDRVLVRRIVEYSKPQMRRILTVAAAVLLTSLASTLLPIFISRGIDQLQANPTQATMLRVAATVAGLACLGYLFNFIRRWFSTEAVGNVVLKLREDAFDAVLKRDLSFYDAFPSGKIVSRVTSDTQAFSQTVTLVMDLLSQLLLIVLLVGYLSTVDYHLTLIMLVLAAVVIAVALAFRRIARYTITQGRRVRAVVSAHVQETVSGISVAKTFRQEQAVYDEFLTVNAQSFRINRRTGWVFSGIFPILNTVSGIGTAALVFFGGRAAQQGTLTAGNWYLFIQGMILFWFPLTSIASFWSQFQLGLAASERVFALLDAEPKVVQTRNDKLPEISGEIRFDKVNFSYNDGEQVLQNFSLTIKAGETLALVGHTGAGKSSIGKLIARFYEFQGGRISVDGHDIRTLDLADYRSHLGIVTQSPFLFDGTVTDNIRYGKSGSTSEEISVQD